MFSCVLCKEILGVSTIQSKSCCLKAQEQFWIKGFLSFPPAPSHSYARVPSSLGCAVMCAFEQDGTMVQVQTDERDPAERSVACKPGKFLDFFRKLPMQRVVLACSKTGMGLKGDGVMEYKVLLCHWWSWCCSFPLQPHLALLLSLATSIQRLCRVEEDGVK